MSLPRQARAGAKSAGARSVPESTPCPCAHAGTSLYLPGSWVLVRACGPGTSPCTRNPSPSGRHANVSTQHTSHTHHLTHPHLTRSLPVTLHLVFSAPSPSTPPSPHHHHHPQPKIAPRPRCRGFVALVDYCADDSRAAVYLGTLIRFPYASRPCLPNSRSGHSPAPAQGLP